MLQRRHLLVPAVLALLLGSAVPAVADDAPPTTEAVAEATVEPTTEPTEEPTAEATEEPTAEATTAPTTDPTAEPSPEPTAEAAPAAQPNRARAPKAVAKQLEAVAAPSTVTTATALTDALSACESGDVITLGADITLTTAATTGCDLTLDLAGHALVVPSIVVSADRHLTIDDSATGGTLTAASSSIFEAGIQVTDARLTINGGTISATGARYAAGIGGGGEWGNDGGNSGIITINGGTVTAQGGYYSAGIGAAGWGFGQVITINGGTVTADGGDGGAGIGSGYNRPFESIAITGGSVTAAGHGGGAGIGTSISSDTGGSISIGAGAQVTADSDTGSAIGGGEHGAGRGTVSINGTARVTGTLDTSMSTFSVGATGRLVGSTTNEAAGPRLIGDAQLNPNVVHNAGVIAPTSVAPEVLISGHHYTVVASTGTVTVYAPSIEAGFGALPAAPARRGVDVFAGWSHGGDPIGATTTLPGSSTDGEPVTIALDADWDEGVASFDPAGSVRLIAGNDPVDLDLGLVDGHGDPVTVDPSDWDLSVPADLDLAHDADGWHLTGARPGSATITATTEAAGRDYTATLEVTVTAGPVASMDLDFAGQAKQGETITMSVSSTDARGFDTGDVTDDVTFTSSVASDVIDGNRITFPHASPHIVTATHANGTTATLRVEVTPAAATPTDAESTDAEPADAGSTGRQNDEKATAALADTGSATSPWWLAAALGLVLAGAAVVRRAQRR
ncbi:hypothetical protein [Aeromicrobium duanguangcaii]|uniref:Gram-positive cocci surface proteins LPxTG domain-containing protein n=1 Tax=Aeromicrobium duanguangcaii TaxID=2968086 RepID=A0ABY5KFP3_9ACTN|nr:hypothetical protein [Aeromicrobium duanguangcaii]MCD9154283.1 hypothetical protein [Aeromicrobium duanguangcaii]UUI68649.1 hypothetical protein NP095_00610 [Aeromicrobium duanguangcaii]